MLLTHHHARRDLAATGAPQHPDLAEQAARDITQAQSLSAVLAGAQSSCAGKHRFTDPNLARRVASRSAHTHAESMTAYRCEECGGWHVGSHLRASKRRRN